MPSGHTPKLRRLAVALPLATLLAGCSDAPTIAAPEPPTLQKAPTAPTPKGTIVFCSEREGASRIFRMFADGTGVTRLTDGSGIVDRFPRLSGEGKEIVFERFDEATSRSSIYRMKADGTGLTNLTRNPAADSCPAWAK